MRPGADIGCHQEPLDCDPMCGSGHQCAPGRMLAGFNALAALVRGRRGLSIAALTSVALAFAGGPVASVALGAGTTPAIPLPTTSTSPLSPGLPASPTPSPTTTTPTVIQTSATNTTGGSSLSGSAALFIAIGAVVVLGGISFYIWRDARRRAPERGGEGYEIHRSGSKRPPKPRKLSPAERKRRKRGRARR